MTFYRVALTIKTFMTNGLCVSLSLFRVYPLSSSI